jgi:hypothetical protein
MSPLLIHRGEVLYQAGQARAHQPAMLTLLGLWSWGEAIFWVILPDFLLVPLGLLAPERRWRFWAVAVLSSSLGTLTLMGLVHLFPGDWLGRIWALPLTGPHMVPRLESLIEQFGWTALWMQPVSGVPVKVWTLYTLTEDPFPFLALWGITTLARALRMAAVTAGTGWLHRRFSLLIQSHWLGWMALYTLAVLVGLVWTSRLQVAP